MPKNTTPTAYATKSISEIAAIARRDAGWGPKGVNYAARPYLDAMSCLDNIGQNYGQDSGKMTVLYFLGNATSWKGEVAREVKKELNLRVKKG